MAEPKCPDCGAAGTDNIVSTPSKELSRERRPWFYIAHCGECGHVYGIFTKHIFGKSGPQLIVEGRK
ncbi:MAG: transcriptional regulator [Gammaproteobacteria bacterium]|nr:transcriptional regulator [Gammaproteobacteria bacterium]